MRSPAAARRARTLGPTLALALLVSQGALAESIPSAGPADGRVRVAQYDANEVYKLRGYVGYEIDLEFEPGETFIGLGSGDLDGLAFVGRENHLFLKPRAAQVATNLTVLTTRRHYHIDYAALAHRPYASDPAVVYSVRFLYPPADRAGDDEAMRVDASLVRAWREREKNADYWYCGDPRLRPAAASDDGVRTRLSFQTRSELPALFVRNEDGSESLLNFSVEDGDVFVHRVARQFVVRRGALRGCIVNRGFRGTGPRLESGTVSPEVERRVQGENP